VPDWNPDAVIPASGLPAWTGPDGSQPPATQLQAGVEVRVAERVGDWARVECWNGWTGWLNGSLLVRKWSPTHALPVGGLDAWDTPDPSQPPSAHLDGEEVLLLDQQPSGWAQVETASGQKPWVDGRRLVARGAAPPPAPDVPPAPAAPVARVAPPVGPAPSPSRPAGSRVEAPFGITMPEWWPPEVPVVPAAGALLVLLGSILPWWTIGFGSASAWDIPVIFLISNGSATLSGLKVGLLLLAVVVVALPALTKKPLPDNLLTIVGLAVVALSLLTLLRGLIGFSAGGFLGGSGRRFTYSPSFGLFLTIVGGVLMSLDWFRAAAARLREQQQRR